jgi:hypothetical protein
LSASPSTRSPVPNSGQGLPASTCSPTTKTGKLINISLWETREEMEAVARGTAAGIHDEAVPETTGVTSLRLETYEVAMQV